MYIFVPFLCYMKLRGEKMRKMVCLLCSIVLAATLFVPVTASAAEGVFRVVR